MRMLCAELCSLLRRSKSSSLILNHFAQISCGPQRHPCLEFDLKRLENERVFAVQTCAHASIFKWLLEPSYFSLLVGQDPQYFQIEFPAIEASNYLREKLENKLTEVRAVTLRHLLSNAYQWTAQLGFLLRCECLTEQLLSQNLLLSNLVLHVTKLC